MLFAATKTDEIACRFGCRQTHLPVVPGTGTLVCICVTRALIPCLLLANVQHQSRTSCSCPSKRIAMGKYHRKVFCVLQRSSGRHTAKTALWRTVLIVRIAAPGRDLSQVRVFVEWSGSWFKNAYYTPCVYMCTKKHTVCVVTKISCCPCSDRG